MWLNEKHIEEGSNHNNLGEITKKYHSNHRTHRYKLHYKSKKQLNRVFIDEGLATIVVIDGRTISAHKFGTRYAKSI